MFEVKRLYVERGGVKKKIMFSPKQLQHLKELGNVEILVFTEDGSEPVEVIPAKVINDGIREWKGITLYEWHVNKPRVNIVVDADLVEWVDIKVVEKRFASRSHAFTVAVMELKRKETVKL